MRNLLPTTLAVKNFAATCNPFTSWTKKLQKFKIAMSMFLLMVFLFSSTASAQCPYAGHPVVNGNPSEWPAILAANGNPPVLSLRKSDVMNGGNTDDVFTNGSADVSLLSGWAWTLSSANDKTDMGDVGAALICDTLYVFADRYAVNGDAKIGIWIFKSSVSLNPNGSFNGVHSEGDILITSLFTNGGGVSTPTIFMWTGGALNSGTIGAFGSLSAVNSTSFLVPSGWNYPGTKGATAGQYAAGSFFEAKIAVSAFGSSGIDPCFATVLFETGVSQGTTSALSDLALTSFSSLPAAPVGGPNSRCGSGTVSLTASGCTGGTLKWYDVATGGTVIATGSPFVTPSISSTTSYWVSCTSNIGCEGPRTEVVATVNAVPGAPGGTPAARCGSGTVTLGASGCTGTYKWYDVATGGTSVSTGASFTTPSISTTTSYWVSCTSAAGCEGPRTEVVATVNAIPSCSFSGSDNVCPGTTNTYSGPAGNDTYAWSITSGTATISGSSSGQTVDVVAPSTCSNYTIQLITTKNGCSSTCSQTFHANDNTPPTITCANVVSPINCPATPVWPAPTVSDLCDPNPIVTFVDGTPVPGACAGTYSLTRTWTATDHCGNAASCSRTIVVQDITAPTLTGTLPAGQTGMNVCYANIPGGPSEAAIAALYTDNCGTVHVTKSGTPTGNNCQWSVAYHYVIVDDCNNFAAAVDITYSGGDTEAPVLDVAPAAVTVQCIGDVPPMTSLTWTDNCDAGGSVAGVDEPLVGGNCGGTITRTWNVMDACGNPAITRTQIITVHDLTAPVISTSATSGDLGCNPNVEEPAFTGLDNCDGVFTPIVTTSGPTNTQGCMWSQTWNANYTDHCGNPATQVSITYTWNVVTAPVFDNCEDGSTDLGCNPVLPSCDNAVTAYNECGNVPVTCTHGPITNVGSCGRQQIFVYSATACGFTSTCTRTYIWTVSTAPVFANCNNTIALGSLPATLPTCANYAQFGGPVTASNQCGPVVPVNCSPGPVTNVGNCGRQQVFTFTATACGLTSTCTRTYTWTVTCGHMFPTATTCCNYASGNTPELLQLCYKSANNTVKNAIPGVMFYYATITAPGSSFTIDVKQSNNNSNFYLLNVQNTANIRLFTANCGTNISYTASLQNNGKDAKILVNGATTGATYIVSVKYDVKSMQGSISTGNPTVTYTYNSYINGSAVPVPGQTGTIDAKHNCQDNTPAPPACTLPAAPTVPANNLITARPVTENAVTNSKEGVSVTAYPNPFEDYVRFSISSDISGMATLEVYNLLGVKLQTVYSGFVFAGKGQTINYQVPNLYRTTLIYKLTVGGKTVTGKLINVK